jgi:outer membrane lipase/esterase
LRIKKRRYSMKSFSLATKRATLVKTKYKQLAFTALFATTALLSACGGSDGSNAPTTTASNIKVFGDSLADSGVFGFKFTVNGATGDNGLIWTERIAAQYGKELCPFFRASGPTTFVAPVATCSSFAIGGGRINSTIATGGSNSPYSIPFQMDAALAGGNYQASDIILVDGGGNDVADLFGGYLGATTPAGQATYFALLSSIVPSANVQAALGQANGGAVAGGAYMQALANRFADAIETKLLAKGAERVVVLNMPAITNTPRFKAVLAGVGAAAGQATATAAQGVAVEWVRAFNSTLSARLGTNPKIALVDFFSEFNAQVTNPAQYGLTNVTTPACPVIGTDAQGLPDYSLPTCTATALDAAGPQGWRAYSFSDGFHPTPRGYELLSQLVAKEMGKKGWL